MKQYTMSHAQTVARAARTATLGLALLAASGISAAATGYDLLRFEDPRGLSTAFFPRGINNAMEVVGEAEASHGFKMTGIKPAAPPASFTIFDVPGAFYNGTYADDINNNGVIVGTYSSYRGVSGTAGFIQAGALGGPVTTVDVPDGVFGRTTLTGLNDTGQVVGTYMNASFNTRSFVLSGSDFTLLQGPQDRPEILAYGINNAGRVVGSVTSNFQFARGFTFQAGNYEVFDAPGATWTQAYGINNAGVIVGAASTGLFVKDGTTFTNLALPAGWQARDAVAADINDHGVVVGYFTDNTGHKFGFLATPTAPVPEPGTWALMLGGGLLLLAARRVLALRPHLAA